MMTSSAPSSARYSSAIDAAERLQRRRIAHQLEQPEQAQDAEDLKSIGTIQ